jgi:hypothetical protein
MIEIDGIKWKELRLASKIGFILGTIINLGLFILLTTMCVGFTIYTMTHGFSLDLLYRAIIIDLTYFFLLYLILKYMIRINIHWEKLKRK